MNKHQADVLRPTFHSRRKINEENISTDLLKKRELPHMILLNHFEATPWMKWK